MSWATIKPTWPVAAGASGGSWPANTPLGVSRLTIEADETHCIAVTVNATTPTILPLEGYTLRASIEHSTSTNTKTYLYTRVGPAAAATINLVLSGNQTGRLSFVAWVLTGCDQSTTFGLTTGAASLSAPSVWGEVGQLLLTIYGNREPTASPSAGFTWTGPAGMTKVGSVSSTLTSGVTQVGTAVYSKLLTGTAATGAQAATCTNPGALGAISIIVNPAQAPAGPQPVEGDGLIAYMQKLGGLTHFYGFTDADPLLDRIGSAHLTNKGGVNFTLNADPTAGGAVFTGAQNSYLETPDDPSFSIAGQVKQGFSVLAFVDVTDWAKGTRDPNNSEYVHYLGKASSYSDTEWLLRHYFSPDTSGQARAYRMSAYAFNPTDELDNGHLGAGSYVQAQVAADPLADKLIAATFNTTTTSLSDGSADPSFPGQAHLNFNGGAWTDTDGLWGADGQYKVHPQRTSSPLRVGGVHDGSRFKGVIRRLAFFNRELSDAEINGIYAQRALINGAVTGSLPPDTVQLGEWVKPLGNALRLDVQADPAPGELVNLVQNPSGALGGWGWITPVPGSGITQSIVGSTSYLDYNAGAGESYLTSEAMPVTAGRYAAASIGVPVMGSNVYWRLRFEWLDVAGAVISSSAQSASLATVMGPYQAPAGTVAARLRIDLYQTSGGGNPTGDHYLAFTEVTVSTATTAVALGTSRTNLVPNPSFEVDVAGWGKYSGFEALTRVTTPTPVVGTGALSFKFLAGEDRALTAGGVSIGDSDLATYVQNIEGGASYVLSTSVRSTLGRRIRLGAAFFSAAGVSVGVVSAVDVGPTLATAWTRYSRTMVAPAGAKLAIPYIVIAASSGYLNTTEIHYLDAVMFEKANAHTDYFDGATAAAGGWTYSWTGTPHQSTSVGVTPNLSYTVPIKYLNILGSTHDITITREALNVGTLSANIVDSALDPSQSALIRPGRAVRLMAYSETAATWRTVFTGTATHAAVEYELTDPNAAKRAHITMEAVDAVQKLANQNRIEGVATIDDLPFVLEGAGTPWNVNGSGNQVASATVVATNDNASAVDQVGITRDSVLGYAWVDRMGVLQAWDRDTISQVRAGELLDENVYRDVVVAYDTDDLINEVNIKYLRLNPDDGSSEEVAYGPYQNKTSIAEWGVRAAEFTVQGLTEEAVDLEAYAQAILDANSTPHVRLNSMDLHVDLTTDWAAVKTASWFAYVDLYDLVEITCTRASIAAQLSRVTGITHQISGPDSKWMVALAFTSDSVVASPNFVPSPTVGGGGKTITELLRPVGEVTMWFGSKTDIPGGWLAMDGSTFVQADYPALYALLGTTVLPNMTDRLPIGAGTKALGTGGGSPTATIAASNLPPHVHTIAHSHTIDLTPKDGATTGGSTTTASRGSAGAVTASGAVAGASSQANSGDGPGSSTPLSVLNPWRSLWFIIRAR